MLPTVAAYEGRDGGEGGGWDWSSAEPLCQMILQFVLGAGREEGGVSLLVERGVGRAAAELAVCAAVCAADCFGLESAS